MTFHGPERLDMTIIIFTITTSRDARPASMHGNHKPHESPWVVTLPLILLAIPSLFIGWFTIEPVLFGDYFGNAIQVAHQHNTLEHVAEEFHGSGQFVLHAITHPGPVYLALFGVFLAWLFYVKRPELPGKVAAMFAPLYKLFVNKFYVDELYQWLFAAEAWA